MIDRLRNSDPWKFFVVLPQASRGLATAWWTLLALAGALPAVFVVAMGNLVRAVEQGRPLGGPLTVIGVIFVAMQVSRPLQASVGMNLGDRLSAFLNGRLLRATNGPQGMAHLERPELTGDLTLARDFDLGISGPPMSISMGFIAGGLVEVVAGLSQAVVLAAYRWWAPLVLVAGWGSTHWLLKESAVWRDRQTPEVVDAQRDADYAYRMAVDAPAAKELRLFGLAGWTVERFAYRRRRLVDLRWQATRLRQRPMGRAVLVVTAANALVFWSIASDAAGGRLGLGSAVTFAAAALGVSAVAFGGLSWALWSAATAVGAVLRLEDRMAAAGSLPNGAQPATGLPAREIRFRNVTFGYESSAEPVLENFDLTIPAGTSLAIVGQNGAGKTTLAKLLCRLYDPVSGAVEADGVDIRRLDLAGWRERVAAVFQDFVRYELPLRDNVAPTGAPDEEILAALDEAGADGLADLSTILARGYENGTDLSGGQWQRVALARALCAVRLGAGVVILDEPTAQLDVRGEAEIFERILATTRHCTTILISHRFSTVRQVDRICVLEHGRVVELGSHDELMTLGGRYRTMFELQASRFGEEDEDVVSLA
ncbi:MAG: ABC transporter ATP-binding protein/permease [Actinobacteria bacterium]|nr:ABC transporter ATP-binding protein/permease [Actinomycetota bacterium]